MIMDDKNTQNLKKNTIISALSLFFQSGYAAALGLIANLVLTIILTPKIFGIYFTVLSLISLLNYFSDIGLAASLIQKKEITDEDVSSTITIQQFLIISVIIIGFFSSRFIKNFYQLPQEGIYLYWALLISFFLSSLKTIPSVFLERKVQFQKIVFVQIIENTFFYLTVIILGIFGFGLKSFTVAVLFRSIIGVIAIYSISFWVPRIGISFSSLRKLLSFGAPFQASSFLALFKDDLIILYLGKVLGFEGLGYIGWAKKWAEAPIRIIMDNISRVLFPVIARIQHDKEKISRLIEKNLYYQTLLLAPTIAGLGLVMSLLVEILPKYSKWTPALPLFYLFCISAFFSSYSNPFINLFNALGKVKISFSFMIFWTVATWLLTPLFTKLFGYYGFPLVQVILSLVFVAVLLKAKSIINFRFIKPVLPSLLATVGMIAIVLIYITIVPPSYLTIITAVLTGLISYLVILKILFKINIFKEIKILFYD